MSNDYIKQLEETNEKLRQKIESFQIREDRLNLFDRYVRWVDYTMNGVITPNVGTCVAEFCLWDKVAYKIIRNANEKYSCYCYIGSGGTTCISESIKYIKDAKQFCFNHLTKSAGRVEENE